MKNILIICQCATNKGDRAIAEYLISKISNENTSVTLSTTDPSLWSGRTDINVIGTGYRSLFKPSRSKFIQKACHEITSLFYSLFVYPELIKPNSKKYFCRKISGEFISKLKEADTVIVTGGHHITSIRNKNALFAITYDIGLAAVYSRRYILWSQTIGPLEFTDNLAKTFFADVIKKAEYVFIRDENSKNCLKNLIGSGYNNIKKTYDSVFGFGSYDYTPWEQRKNKVGISIFNGLKKAFDTYPAIAKLLDYYALNGYDIEFFRMEHNDKELQDINHVIGLMTVKANVIIYPFETTANEHLKEISECRYFIGYKTHSVIMALTTATPLIGICYHSKTRDFMADYGLSEYAVDDTALDTENLIRLADKLSQNAGEIHLSMKNISKAQALAVENDIRKVTDE